MFLAFVGYVSGMKFNQNQEIFPKLELDHLLICYNSP